ncbi:Arc family DNA-binding protein [Acetobacter pasteurianus]|uniref:Arc family DNA-binding protein n=1 Tax=Acetobacter pasteurianus TaxID=438 RepID=UPI00286D11F6|nr:Arc family DNA-binding protein [Acetobacter pasteurianus]
MSDERRVPITLRMPRALLDNLKAQADLRSHSMNAEIVQRLEESVYLSLSAHALEEGEELTDNERSLVRMWRAMNEGERLALRAVAERLADKADPGGAA